MRRVSVSERRSWDVTGTMKSSSDVMRTLRGRRRWHATSECRQRSAPLTLRDYIEVMRATMWNIAEAVCALDLSGHIQFANPQIQRMLALPESALIGRSLEDIGRSMSAPGRDANAQQAFAELREAFRRRTGQDNGESEYRWADDSLAQGRCSLRPLVHEGRTLGMLLIASQASQVERHDAMETHQAERRLRIIERVGDITLAQLSLDELLQALLDSMRDEVGLENVVVFLMDKDGDKVTAYVASGAGAEFTHQTHIPLEQSVIGEALQSRKSIFISDARSFVERSAHFTPSLRASMNVESLMVVPLVVEDRPIGAIYVGGSEPDCFSQEDVRLVELVGQRAALAIERAHANDEAENARERLRFLNDASGALNAVLDYRETTLRLASILTPALADACAIYLLEDDGLLRKVATQAPALGLLAPDPVDTALRRLIERLETDVEVSADDATCAIGRSVGTLAPVFERQPLSDGAADAGEPGAEVTTSQCVAAPLVVRQHALGALYLVARPGRAFSDGDLVVVKGLAERAAVAIDNARLYIETQQALASGSATATQLDTIFDATDVGIFVTDANGEYLRINPYGAQLLGLPQNAEERVIALAAPVFEFRTSEGDAIPLERNPLRLARTQGRSVEQRIIIHRRDTGKDIQALARCTPWLDAHNQIAGAIGVITDITTISELERQKDQFLGIASHELKTPLTSLKILAQLLGRKMEGSGETRDLEQAKRMQVAITRMERLINDLLDVSRIQEGKLALNLELTDLGIVASDAIHEQEMLNQRAIRFIAPADADLVVYADAERIYQVLTNLLSNALKYSPATEAVVVRARVTDDECLISVHDHGPGVPPEALDHVFDRFFRVPGMQVQSGSGVGLGLGLSISKDIIARHGGRLWVESKLGHGSVFTMALPRISATR